MDQVKHAVETGALRAGEQLPTIRKLADILRELVSISGSERITIVFSSHQLAEVEQIGRFARYIGAVISHSRGGRQQLRVLTLGVWRFHASRLLELIASKRAGSVIN